MSAGRILRKNRQILRKNKYTKALQNSQIRTFLAEQQLEMLSSPSLYLPFHELKSAKDDLIKLKYLAAHKRSVYMTDIQNHNFFQFFVIHNNAREGLWVHDQYNKPQDYKLYINPTITKLGEQKANITQSCNSFPFFAATIQRSPKIQVSYQDIINLEQKQDNQKLQPKDVTQTLDGFKSIVFQHCMDHLKGHNFFTPNLTKGRLSLQFNQKFFQKTRFLIKQYNVRVKKGLQQNKIQSQQFKKMKKEYEQKIRNSYIKQSENAKQWSQQFKF